MNLSRRWLLAGWVLLVPSLLWSETSTLPSLEKPVIGKITINRHQIFDPGPGKKPEFPYSTVNKLHILTKEAYVRSELLFEEGDPFDPALIAESERLLRNTSLFRYAAITYDPPVDGKVNVNIRTDDVWTTAVQLRYEHVGGKDLYGIGLLERNLLGYGIQMGGFIRKDIDRTKRGVSFRDPHILKSPVELFAGYGKDEKGREYEIRVEKPFRSVLEKTSGGVRIAVSDDEERLFEQGDEIAFFQHEQERVRTTATINPSPSSHYAGRWGLVHLYEKDTFSQFRFLRPRTMPVNRTISAVMLGYESKQVRYMKRRGIITFDRDEDINVGWEWKLEAGPSLESIGATRDGALVQGRLGKNWPLGADGFFFSRVKLMSRYESNQARNGLLKWVNHVVLRDWINEHTATLTSTYKGGRNLDAENQLLLGGDSGLRAYSVREFSGSKSLLFTLENRKVILYDWLDLVTLGWAVFADTGAVWKEGERFSFDEFKSDTGFGIRFAPTRSVSPTIIRADVAYALNDNDRDSRWVFYVGGEVIFGGSETRKFDL